MNTAVIYQEAQVIEKTKIAPLTPVPAKGIQDPKLENLLRELNPTKPWGARKIAAQQLGYARTDEAIPALLKALPNDPFWMVRCAIIQALEMIGDQVAIPVLERVAVQDGFQVVRAHAAKAVERLTKKEDPQY
jgi:HEAT repeat protein